MDYGKKAQASTEYLIIMAIAIIIAIVVISVLSGFIKVGGSTSMKKAKTYWKSADIGFNSWTMSPEGIVLVLQNNLEYKISVDWVNVTWPSGTSVILPVDKVLYPGDTYTLRNYTVNCSPVGVGYSLSIRIQYDNLDDGIENNTWIGKERLTGDCASQLI